MLRGMTANATSEPIAAPADAGVSLADLMELALYDPEAGYYAAGRVKFGHQKDFWTFPERLSPVFGRLVARHAAAMCAQLEAEGALGPDEPFVIVELGAGDGTLARDVCDAALALGAEGGAAARLADRLRYRIGERSPALQRVQAETCAAHVGVRLEHLPQSAADDVPAAPRFKGLLLSNELVDVYPHHRVRPLDGTVLTLVPRVSAAALRGLGLDTSGEGEAALSLADLRQAARRVMSAGSAPEIRFEPRWVPLDAHPDGPALAHYLQALAPVVAARARNHDAPPELLVSPRVTRLYRLAADALEAGWMLTVDYGGTATHALDPAPTMAHLRIFPTPDGAEDGYVHADAVELLGWPGTQDVTVEIDFTHLAHAGASVGLAPIHFGPQGHLAIPEAAATPDRPALDPMASAEQARVRAALTRKYAMGPFEAAKAAFEVGRGFCGASAGFRLLLQQTAGLASTYALPHPSDPVLPQDLPVLAQAATPDAVRQALARAGLPEEAAAALRPAGCPISDLDDHGQRRSTAAALRALAAADLLALPR